MSLLVILFSAVLFFVLTPGVFLRFPKNGDKYTVAGVHAVVFALIFGLTYKFVWRLGAKLRLEGFEGADNIEKDNKKQASTYAPSPKPSTR